MSGRSVRLACAALAAAVAFAFATTPEGYLNYRYALGNYSRAAEDRAIRETIKLFSATAAGIFLTGGGMQGINILPAEQLVKRRIYQDTRFLADMGMVLAHDRDRSDVREIRVLSPFHAVALVNEAWFLAYQDIFTRQLLSNKKADIITVRYLLKKNGGRWGIVDYEVYVREDEIPPLDTARFLKW